jgi:hypothetical protein
VLLTRSRLCPRPKPGSSLHLHVLGTPPAFVLSQDQTLREELQHHKESSADLSWQIRSYAHTREARCTQWASGARRGQSWHRRPRIPEGVVGRRRRTSGHTSRSKGRSRGAHAVEFSKTVAPLGEGSSFPWALPGPPNGIPGRTGKYSAYRRHFPARATSGRCWPACPLSAAAVAVAVAVDSPAPRAAAWSLACSRLDAPCGCLHLHLDAARTGCAGASFRSAFPALGCLASLSARRQQLWGWRPASFAVGCRSRGRWG